jgi:hypothetical protein
MAWSDPSHSSFRFPYDCLRGAHREKGGSFTHLFTWRVWRGALRREWKHWERRAWAPSFMEAKGLIILWCGFLLGGGHTLGGGCKLSGQ